MARLPHRYVENHGRARRHQLHRLFREGRGGRVVARYSTGGSQPRGGHYRSLALVGRLPAGLGGGDSAEGQHFHQEISARRGQHSHAVLRILAGLPLNRGKVVFLFINGLFLRPTKNSERQLYEIAELK
jgi:hypothetical protein